MCSVSGIIQLNVCTLVTLYFAIDGPNMTVGPHRYAILEGDSVLLTCGYELISNPQATITWKHPNGSLVTSSDERVLAISEEKAIRLNISDVSFSHNGSWACVVEVNRTCVGEQLGENGDKVCDGNGPIGRIQHEIELVVVGKCV